MLNRQNLEIKLLIKLPILYLLMIDEIQIQRYCFRRDEAIFEPTNICIILLKSISPPSSGLALPKIATKGKTTELSKMDGEILE